MNAPHQPLTPSRHSVPGDARRHLACMICMMIIGISNLHGGTIGYTVDADAIFDMPFDEFWVERLEEQGHTVVNVGASDFPDDHPEVDVFIVSNDVNSGDFNLDFLTDPRPIIVFEDALFDEFAISVAGGRETEAEILIEDPDHPLAAGLSGTVEIYDDFQGITRIGDLWAPGAHVVASIFDIPTIAVLERGAEDLNGDAATGMRISMFPQDAGFGDLYTDAGLALLDASVNYALGVVAPGVLGDFNNDGALSIEDVDSLITEIVAGGQNPDFDLNADATVDQKDLLVWAKDLKKTWIGDANLDGEFNSSDFVAVFTSGKFERDVDASWSEGDWNADKRFGSGDFVAAFTDGGFERGPRPPALKVPEPSGLVGCLMTLSFYRRRR